ncbi:ABC transporter permease [Anaerolineae bacterium CFX9]|jgi:spermidine/putrescine transport system permease protein|nr:ABC transporter permease [Anaerolineae bacterium CFX9]
MAVSLSSSGAEGYTTRERTRGRALAVPAIIWLVFFFIAPLLIVAFISFLTRPASVAILYDFPFTLEAYSSAFNNIYGSILWRSVVIAFVTTIICLLMGYPLAFYISTRKNKRVQSFALFLVILPFWTNFLVRTYAWQLILGNEGVINSLLMGLGIIQQPLEMLLTPGAVLVGLVYSYLPFMVLPIYTSVERFDFRLVEAANDLGANDWRAFWRVVFPLTLPGVAAGSILVFIPTIGAYITPDLLGGTRGIMIGSLITRQFLGTGSNWPLGASLSVVMMLMVIAALILYSIVNRRRV